MAGATTWLTSYPKSGNTWARALIVAYVKGSLDINSMQWTFTDTFELSYHRVSPIPFDRLSVTEKNLLRPAALMDMAVMHRERPLIVKTHNACSSVDGIDLIPKYLTRNALYIIRDPRDVAISFAEHMGYSIDEAVSEMGEVGHTIGAEAAMFHFISSWSNHVKSWIEAKINVQVIRYEDMLEDTHECLRQMLSWIGIEVDEKRIDAAVELARFDRMSRQEKEKGFVEASKKTDKFFKRGTAGHWRGVLTPDQISKIENDHGDMMDRFGYELSTIKESAA